MFVLLYFVFSVMLSVFCLQRYVCSVMFSVILLCCSVQVPMLTATQGLIRSWGGLMKDTQVNHRTGDHKTVFAKSTKTLTEPINS